MEGVAFSFENALKRMGEAEVQGSIDQAALIREFEVIISRQIDELHISSPLCAYWVKSCFLTIADPSHKGRKYRLSAKYQQVNNLSLVASDFNPVLLLFC